MDLGNWLCVVFVVVVKDTSCSDPRSTHLLLFCSFNLLYPNLSANNSREKENVTMPLYMDTHCNVEGLTAEGVTAAHAKDLEVQNKYGVKYLRYWYNEGTGKVFCLCEAPSKEAAEAVHREAHGGVADEITEVREGT
jgi:Nickel responsive protein SCO4226-like